MPGSDVPGIDIPYIDKWVHIGLFFALSVLWTLWLELGSNKPKVKKLPLFLLLLFYGMVIELIQHTLLPTRSADPWDVVANAAGILLGMWTAYRWLKAKGLKL